MQDRDDDDTVVSVVEDLDPGSRNIELAHPGLTSAHDVGAAIGLLMTTGRTTEAAASSMLERMSRTQCWSDELARDILLTAEMLSQRHWSRAGPSENR